MIIDYEIGCSPSAIQRKYGLTYEQGYELAERLKKTQELELENTKLKELLKACRNAMNDDEYWVQCDLIKQIDQVLGEE